MANDKKFVVKNGLTAQNVQFVDDVASTNNVITVSMLGNDTLSFSGNSGQLFSITDSLSGTIFAVNDISGVPSIEVDDDGTIRLAETFGNVLIGTAVDDGVNKLQVVGTVSANNFIGNFEGTITTANNSVNLGGQAPSYYLDWTNTTNKPDPNVTVTLSGDVSGSGNATLTDLANGTITITTAVADDSHNHVISNVDGLQAALDAKLDTSTYTAADVLTKIKTVDGATSGLDADLLDGQHGSHYLDYTNFTNTPTIPQSGVDFDPAGTDNSTDVTLAGSYDYLTITGQQITLNQVDAATDISGLATVATSGSYNDLSNLPTLYTTANANTDIDARVTKSFVDALNVDADTIDGLDSTLLSRKVMETASGGASDANYWAKLATYSITGNFNDGSFLYYALNEETSQSGVAIFAVNVRRNNVTLGESNTVGISILGIHGTDCFNDDAFKLIDNGSGTDIELWVQKNSAYDHIGLYEQSTFTDNVSVTYHNNAAWVATEPVGTGNNVRSSGLRYRNQAVWHSGNDGAGSGLDADLLDGQQGSYYLDWTNVTNKPDPTITVTLTGDVTGSGNTTLTDLANGSISITTTSVSGGGGGGLFKGENGTIGSASGAGDIFRVNEKELNTNVTIGSTENASATGPLTVANGVVLTVSSGGSLVIL